MVEIKEEEKLGVAESSNNEKPSIKINKIWDLKEGKKTQMVTVSWLTKKEGGSSLNRGTAFLLGSFSNNVEKRASVVNVEPAVLEEYGVKVGDNLNEIFEKNGIPSHRLTVSEIKKSEFDSLIEANDRRSIGYQEKVNPSTGEVLLNEGETIYRKVYLTDLSVADTYLPTTSSIKAEVKEEPVA